MPWARHRALLLIGGTLLADVLFAVSDPDVRSGQAVETRITRSTVQPVIDAPPEEQLARDWGLQPEEWVRFRALMRGPLGIYAPNLDPLSALGIEARSDEERRHFAELQVRAEGRRVEKLLAYQRAYDEAWKRLRPGLQRVNEYKAMPASRTLTDVAAPRTGRLAVFVKDNCSRCEQSVQQLQAAGREFDLYMVGSRQDDTRIREWAARAGIDPAKVRARSITLNHDAGRWLSIGGQGELPAVLTEVNGQWQRQ